MAFELSLPEIILLVFSVFVASYVAFLAYVLTRLWYYDGALGPEPERYIVLPQYVKDILLTEDSDAASTTGSGTSSLNQEQASSAASTTSRRKTTAAKNAAARSVLGGAIRPSRWRGSVILDPNQIDEDFELGLSCNSDKEGESGGSERNGSARKVNRDVKKELLEQKRISRMPHFIQDDCGDGSLFPDVVETDPNAPGNPWERFSHLPTEENDSMLGVGSRRTRTKGKETPGPSDSAPKFREKPGNYITMGLRKLDLANWLSIDSSYSPFHAARAKILEEKKDEVLQVKSEAEDACEELMRMVVGFLVEKYPDRFEIVDGLFGAKSIKNKIVGEQFKLSRPYDVHPLELCARLAMEDFNILMKSDFTGEHRLVASATLFPAGWRLRERIGKSVTDLYGPVPLWKGKLSKPVEHYFARLNSSSCMERPTFFIQIKPDSRPLDKLLFIQEGKDFFPGDFSRLDPAFIIVRRERQTFRRSPESDAIVFTVKTTVQRLVDLPVSERKNLVKEIRAWPRAIATYKGRDLWQRAVVSFCEGRSAYVEDRDLGSQVGTLTRVSEDN